MSAIQLEQDFPIGFAEDRNQLEDSTTAFYVEWLEDSLEFPGLASASSLSTANLTSGNWELLQRKELKDDESSILEDDENAWSKIVTSGQQPLYAQVAEKNAAELQPIKRNVQPLWPNHVNPTRTKPPKEEETAEEELNQDLFSELIDVHKSHSRRSSRMSRKRKFHDLRTVDIHVEGVFRAATSQRVPTDLTWLPSSNFDQVSIYSPKEDKFYTLDILDKAYTLRYVSRFTHNFKKYAIKNSSTSSFSKHPAFPDGAEYSVHARIIKN